MSLSWNELDELLSDEPVDELEAFLVTCEAAGRFWSEPVVDNDRFNRGPKPFHVLLLLSDARNEEQRERILDVARRADVRAIEIPRRRRRRGCSLLMNHIQIAEALRNVLEQVDGLLADDIETHHRPHQGW